MSGSWETGCGRFRSDVSKPVKHSIAVVVRKDDLILTIRRADNDDEFPGVRGVPAGSFRNSESVEDLIARIGQQKLGVVLTPLRKLAEGVQDRAAYRLEMELWEASMEGTPDREFKWSAAEALRPGMAQGSLCCELALGWDARKGKSRLSL
jgi:8-oxo-dGTP diphosphatase